jgi:tetratricopeptide (TPR) repeat protein
MVGVCLSNETGRIADPALSRVISLTACLIRLLTYFIQSRSPKIEMYERVLNRYEKTLEPEQTSTRETFNNLGVLYWKQGELGKAEEMYKQALKGYEKVFGPEHESTLSTVNKLRHPLQPMGKAR